VNKSILAGVLSLLSFLE